MNTYVLIFLGCGVGGLLRYWVSTSMYFLLGRGFPYGTLIVNVSGSFVMGFLFILLLERASSLGGELRALLLVGFLGGYTTFSSFSMETFLLIESGEWIHAGLNMLLSVVLCVAFAWLGVLLGRTI